MKNIIVMSTIILLGMSGLMGQNKIVNLLEKKTTDKEKNVVVEQLHSDKRATSFLIWVKEGVEEHYHATHTEQVYVLSGKGIMTIEGKEFLIKKGDFIIIPKGVAHSVRVKGRKPLKALSVQAPEFTGKDRIFTKSKDQ